MSSHLLHTPFRPARNDLAESVFAERWLRLNTENPQFLASILNLNRSTVRAARIAASFITWAGTSVGAAFIEEARARTEQYGFSEPAYLATWAIKNARRRSVSANVRLIEFIVSPNYLFENDSGVGAFSNGSAFQKACSLAITQSDIDVIESMVVWLSTGEGDSFVNDCVVAHKAKQDLARVSERMASAYLPNAYPA